MDPASATARLQTRSLDSPPLILFPHVSERFCILGSPFARFYFHNECISSVTQAWTTLFAATAGRGHSARYRRCVKTLCCTFSTSGIQLIRSVSRYTVLEGKRNTVHDRRFFSGGAVFHVFHVNGMALRKDAISPVCRSLGSNTSCRVLDTESVHKAFGLGSFEETPPRHGHRATLQVLTRLRSLETDARIRVCATEITNPIQSSSARTSRGLRI